MAGEKYKKKHGEEAYIKKYKSKLYKKMKKQEIAEKEKNEAKNIKQIYNNELNERSVDRSNVEYDANDSRLAKESQLNETMDSSYSENGTKKKDFRKKNVRLAPRNPNTSYSLQNNQSIHETNDEY